MNRIEKRIIKELSSERIPRENFWFLLADKPRGTFTPSKSSWQKVWLEFKELYKDKKTINIKAVKTYFRVQFEKAKRSSRLKSQIEEKWWKQIKKLTPGVKKIRHAALPETSMHLDIFIPEKMTAFEIQGEQHWQPIKRFGGAENFALRQERDARKRKLCSALGIKLIEITDNTALSHIVKVLQEINSSLP